MAGLNDKLKNDMSGAFVTIFLLIVLIIPGAFWTGFVMHQLYNWFVLPIPGAPIISIGQMLGISLIINLALSGVQRQTDDAMEKAESWTEVFTRTFVKMLMTPAWILFFGWLYQLVFMR